MTLSQRIVAYRTREDVSQARFADMVGVGLRTIFRAENGQNVSKITEEKIERVLKEAVDGKT